MKRRELLLRAALASLWPGFAAAQAWPSKPSRLMVGASPGGGTDIIARMLGEKFAAAFGQPYLVENRPGASNTIAADITAKATPDGHTLLVATNTGQAIAPHLIKLGFDALKDIQPIGLIVEVPQVLVVGPSVTVANVAELIALMKAKPGDVKYASSGVGSTQHIAGEAFDAQAGIKSTHVPYKGSSQAHLDLIAGQVQIMFDTTSSAMGQIRGGKLRPLAVTSAKRSTELPMVPTMAEAGLAGFEMTTWYGLFTSAGVPKPVVERLHAELTRALALPDVQTRLKGLGGEPGTLSTEQFAQMNRLEYERMGKLIRDAKIQAN